MLDQEDLVMANPPYLGIYKMGCLRLTYQENGERTNFLTLGRKSDRSKNCNKYYAFGLQTSQSWTRENTTNTFLYNSGTEQNPTTGLYDLAFRNYDPVLGRMAQVDPMADMYGSWTPYKYGLNDPMYWSDPSGALEDTRSSFQRADDDFRSLNTFGSGMYGDGYDAIYAGPSAFGKEGVGGGYGTLAFQSFVADHGGFQFTYYDYSVPSGIDADGNRTPTLNVVFLNTPGMRSLTAHQRIMNNPLVRAMHRSQEEFASNPFGGAILALVSGGAAGGAIGLISRATIGARSLSAAVDLITQVGINSASTGSLALSRINWTSVALSAANPSATFNSVLKNSLLSSAFEMKVSGSSNILNGKSPLDIALSSSISIGTFGFLKGAGSLSGNYFNGYSRSVESSLLSNGFTYGSNAMRNAAYIWGGSKIVGSSGFHAWGANAAGALTGN